MAVNTNIRHVVIMPPVIRWHVMFTKARACWNHDQRSTIAGYVLRGNIIVGWRELHMLRHEASQKMTTGVMHTQVVVHGMLRQENRRQQIVMVISSQCAAYIGATRHYRHYDQAQAVMPRDALCVRVHINHFSGDVASFTRRSL